MPGKQRLVTLASLTLAFFFMSTLPAFAVGDSDRKQTSTRSTAEATAQVSTQTTTARYSTAATNPEVDALRRSIKQCGRSCKMGSASKQVAAPGGGTRDYDCDDNGNCHCFGAQDCVAMAPVCEEGTLGCNDQGCICQEAD